MKYESNWETNDSSFFDEAMREFGLDSPSRKGSSVGDRAVKTLAQNIHDRAIQFEGSEGRWRDNADSTIRKKGFNAPNFESGSMISEEQIAGQVAISKHAADMVYGKDEANKAKAHYAHEGQSHKKIKRPFMAITEADADAVLDGLADDIVNNFRRG